MARSVYDLAVMLGVMTGVDPTDPATEKSRGLHDTDYTGYLDSQALQGARIGLPAASWGSTTRWTGSWRRPSR